MRERTIKANKVRSGLGLTLFALANGSVIRTDLAISVFTTSLADLSSGKATAVLERISGEASGAPADGHVISDVTLGTCPDGMKDRSRGYRVIHSILTRSAGRDARIDAVIVLTSLAGRALRVANTLATVALLVRVANVIGQAVTNRPLSSTRSAINLVPALGIATTSIGY